jgi:phospholipid/cholesterol/gamma-HCH transport system permease protein
MLTSLGRSVLSFIRYLGELAVLASETGQSLVVAKFRGHLFLRQIYEVGWRSQLVVIVTGMFTGAVLTAQTVRSSRWRSSGSSALCSPG